MLKKLILEYIVPDDALPLTIPSTPTMILSNKPIRSPTKPSGSPSHDISIYYYILPKMMTHRSTLPL